MTNWEAQALHLAHGLRVLSTQWWSLPRSQRDEAREAGSDLWRALRETEEQLLEWINEGPLDGTSALSHQGTQGSNG